MKEKIIERLKLPEVKDIEDLDDPAATLMHARIIQQKRFLRRFYIEAYQRFKEALGPLLGQEVVVELGSGGGFIKQTIPQVITSDILQIPIVDVVFSGEKMPFQDEEVESFMMVDVFHHIKDPQQILDEMQRCLRPGGRILMVEPANTPWARFIWTNFHHENFDPCAGWEITGTGPMSDANGALPWIIFKRDEDLFQEKYPHLTVNCFKAHTPFKYLLSGGVSMKQLLPDFCYPLIHGLEILLSPLNGVLGMFYFIEIQKQKGVG